MFAKLISLQKRLSDAICDTYKIATKSAKAPFEIFEIPVNYCKQKRQSAIQGNVAMRISSQKVSQLKYLTEINATVHIFEISTWKRQKVLTNAALRPALPPWPSLWMVLGRDFTRSTAFKNFGGGLPTFSTMAWALATFSSNALMSRSGLIYILAFVSCSVTAFNCCVAFNCTSV
jgi:hypothetical protein